MKYVSFDVSVRRLSYICALDGTLIPRLQFFPRVQLDGTHYITAVAIGKLAAGSVGTVAYGDAIRISFPIEQPMSEVKVELRIKAVGPRRQLMPEHCPVCGSPLFHTATGAGRCANRECMGQMSKTVTSFLSILNVMHDRPLPAIIDYLLAGGYITSLTDLFFINPLEMKEINPFNVQRHADDFSHVVKVLQRILTPKLVLLGLRVPGWTEDTVESIVTHAHHRLHGATLLSLMSPSTYERIPEVDWRGWKEMIALSSNRALIERFHEVLHHAKRERI